MSPPRLTLGLTHEEKQVELAHRDTMRREWDALAAFPRTLWLNHVRMVIAGSQRQDNERRIFLAHKLTPIVINHRNFTVKTITATGRTSPPPALQARSPYAALDHELSRVETWFDDVAMAYEGIDCQPGHQPFDNTEYLRQKTVGEALVAQARRDPGLGLHLFMVMKLRGAGYLAQAPFLADYEAFCAFFGFAQLQDTAVPAAAPEE